MLSELFRHLPYCRLELYTSTSLPDFAIDEVVFHKLLPRSEGSLVREFIADQYMYFREPKLSLVFRQCLKQLQGCVCCRDPPSYRRACIADRFSHAES